jgi:hypothetical protein
MKILLILEKHPEILIRCRGRQTSKLMLKSEEKKNAEIKSSTLGIGQFGVKSTQKCPK